jgi:hypothetical protein
MLTCTLKIHIKKFNINFFRKKSIWSIGGKLDVAGKDGCRRRKKRERRKWNLERQIS